jgi:hypothetical protein
MRSGVLLGITTLFNNRDLLADTHSQPGAPGAAMSAKP